MQSLFGSRSFRLGRPIAGLQIRIHRSCALLPVLLLLTPPITVPGGGLLTAGLVSLFALGLGIAIQTAATMLMARMTGAVPGTVFILPFGAVVDSRLGTLPLAMRLAVDGAGPLAIALVGLALTLSPRGLGSALGPFLIGFALFLAAPGFPLPGGRVYRDWLRANGSGHAEADRRALELTRRCALVLALLFNPVLLYALFVLWVIAHLELMPGSDLATVCRESIAWFRRLAKTLHTWISRIFLLVVLPAALLTLPNLEVHAAAPWEPSVAYLLNIQQAQARSLAAFQTNLVRLSASLAGLTDRLRRLETNQVAALVGNQQHLTREVAATTSRLVSLDTGLRQMAATIEALRRQNQQESQALLQTLAAVRARMDNPPPQTEPATQTIAELRRQIRQAQQDLQRLARHVQAPHRAANQPPPSAWFISALGLSIGLATAGLFFSLTVWRRSRPTASAPNRSARQESTEPAGQPSDEPSTPRVTCPRPPAAGVSDNGCPADTTAQPPPDSKPSSPISPLPQNSTGPSRPRPACRSLLARAVPPPATVLARLLSCATRCRHIAHKPSAPRAVPWNLGSGSIPGPVRTRNDDFALAFEIAGSQVVLVADGVSGEPLGGAAAWLACQSAGWSIIRQLGKNQPLPPQPAHVADLALHAASKALQRIASAHQCTRGFRTTLIIVVANFVEYGFAYIGDGEGTIARADGRQERFLTPQRAEGDGACFLSACLGPSLLGAPVTGSVPRQPGDLLILATDGVFSDAVEFPENLVTSFVRGATTLAGNLQRTIDQVLNELCAARDKEGFLFDDNLSLALVGTGQPPVPPLTSAQDQPATPQIPSAQSPTVAPDRRQVAAATTP